MLSLPLNVCMNVCESVWASVWGKSERVSESKRERVRNITWECVHLYLHKSVHGFLCVSTLVHDCTCMWLSVFASMCKCLCLLSLCQKIINKSEFVQILWGSIRGRNWVKEWEQICKSGCFCVCVREPVSAPMWVCYTERVCVFVRACVCVHWGACKSVWVCFRERKSALVNFSNASDI